MRAEQSLSDQAFCAHLNRRIGELMILAVYVSKNASSKECFTGPLLADLLSEATKIEELLDAYGVKNNRHWYPLRQAVAPIKLFSNVSYILIHILRFLPNYHLLPIAEDFPAATEKALAFTCSILVESTEALIRQARKLDIKIPESVPTLESFGEEILRGNLASDRTRQKVASPAETVVYLATAFLNLAEQSTFLHVAQNQQVDNYADWIPDPISEERLRNLEEMFHNLQSLYDTHISDSNVESLDDSLPVLRGHITVIYHLLETATAFTHFCERHILSFSPRPRKNQRGLIDPGKLLDVLIHYSVAFASRYISRTRSLCHDMLRRYAIQGRITVPAPRYRGFHVRPSTLVAKIVSHYGSQVQMQLAGEIYNAGVTLDLFRANEKINAGKKRWLRAEVHELGLECRPGNESNPEEKIDEEEAARIMQRLAHSAIQALFAQNKLVLYERNLPLGDIKALPDETAAEYVTRALIQLLTMGKIDVVMDINVTFTGDQRVLQDIKLLAENGYGEDDFGNNLPLPEKLSYLRR
ncbi:MAG: hypothetical protein JSV89_06120 [Spirochaetaceae bacterium]|nr:MAG: hypothetical protein JSV89_06120 [Spirochaetaceae bacterium]